MSIFFKLPLIRCPNNCHLSFKIPNYHSMKNPGWFRMGFPVLGLRNNPQYQYILSIIPLIINPARGLAATQQLLHHLHGLHLDPSRTGGLGSAAAPPRSRARSVRTGSPATPKTGDFAAQKLSLVGGIPTPLKNDGVRQIGSSSQLLEKVKNVPNHQQTGIQYLTEVTEGQSDTGDLHNRKLMEIFHLKRAFWYKQNLDFTGISGIWLGTCEKGIFP